MMASKKSEAGSQRPKQKSRKQLGMMQFVLIGVGVIVVIVVAMLLSGGGGKKAAAPKAKTAAADTDTYGGTKKSAAHVTQRAKKEEERAKLREARLQRKLEARANEGRTDRSAGGSRTKRTSTGGFSSGGEARAAGSPSELRAIIDDGSGTRAALVGQRRLRVGDDIEGRRILEVTGDGVKVEYKASTYTVRIGQKVY
jgi:hypothetical protein